jgi:hypothetical protein
VGTHQETALNIDFGTNNERQDCKTGTIVGSTCERVRVNGGDEDEGIGLMGFIYIKEINNETSIIALSRAKRRWGRETVGQSNQCTT